LPDEVGRVRFPAVVFVGAKEVAYSVKQKLRFLHPDELTAEVLREPRDGS
jgi:hypothetical protein